MLGDLVNINRMRKFLVLLFAVFLAALIASACYRKTVPEPQGGHTVQAATDNQAPCALPAPDTFATDNANVLSQSEKDELETKLKRLKSNGRIEFAVVLVESTGKEPIRDYSLGLANCWGVGGKEPDKAGVLLLIALKDRKWYIQITRVLEQVLTNEQVFEIGNKMTPDFKNGNYSAGINKSVDAMIDVLAHRRNFSMS